jgi:hypothetical protein
MPPVLTRLVALDPSNAENWMLFARAYNALAKDAQTRKNTAANRAFTDSTMRYFNRAERVIENVTFTEFTVTDSTVRVRGTLEDRRAAKGDSAAAAPAPAATPAASTAPKTHEVIVEFLGADGKTIVAESVKVGPTKPGERAQFTAAAAARGVVGFKYVVVPQ